MKQNTFSFLIFLAFILGSGCAKKHRLQHNEDPVIGGSGGNVTVPDPGVGGSGGSREIRPEEPIFVSPEAENRFELKSPFCVLTDSEKESCGFVEASTLAPVQVDSDHWQVQGCLGMSRPMRNSCGGNVNTFEWIWKWQPEEAGFYTLRAVHPSVSLNPRSVEQALTVSLRRDCGSIESEVFCEEDSQTLQINAQAAETYYILVEGKNPSAMGLVTLDIFRAEQSEGPVIDHVDFVRSESSIDGKGYKIKIRGSDENADVTKVVVRFYEEGQADPIAFGHPGDFDFDEEEGGYRWDDLDVLGKPSFVAESSLWLHGALSNAVRAEVILVDLQGERSAPYDIDPIRTLVARSEVGEPCEEFYVTCHRFRLFCDSVSQAEGQCAERQALPSAEISNMQVFKDGDRLTFHGEFRDAYRALTSLEVDLFDGDGEELSVNFFPYYLGRFSLMDLKPREDGTYLFKAQIRAEGVLQTESVEFRLSGLVGSVTSLVVNEFGSLPQVSEGQDCDSKRIENMCEKGFQCTREARDFKCRENANPRLVYAGLDHQPDLHRFGFSARWEQTDEDEVGLFISWNPEEGRLIERIIPFDSYRQTIVGFKQGVATFDYFGEDYGFAGFVPERFKVAIVDVYGRRSEMLEVTVPEDRFAIPEGPDVCDPRLVVNLCNFEQGCVDPEGDGEFQCLDGVFLQPLDNLRVTYHRDTEVYDGELGHSVRGRLGNGSYAHRLGFEFEYAAFDVNPVGLEFRLRNGDEVITDRDYLFQNLIPLDETVSFDENPNAFRSRAHVLLDVNHFEDLDGFLGLNGVDAELTFTHADVRLVFPYASSGLWQSVEVSAAEELAPGQSCDPERGLNHCDEEHFCHADQANEPLIYTCEPREDFSECPADWVTLNLNDHEVAHSLLPGEVAWEHVGSVTNGPVYADASCGSRDAAINRVYSFTAPERGLYAFRLQDDVEGTFLFARSQCGFADTELFCEARCEGGYLEGRGLESASSCDGFTLVPAGLISAGQILEIEANQTMYLFVSVLENYSSYRGLYNFRVEKYEPSAIRIESPETRAWINRQTGQVTMELTGVPSSFAVAEYLSLRALPTKNDVALEGQTPKEVAAEFEISEGVLHVVSHFNAGLSQASLNQVDEIEVWIREKGEMNLPVTIHLSNPQVIARGQDCDSVGAKTQCAQGFECFNPNENLCGEEGGPWPEDQRSICVPATEQCPALECPADWQVISLNDFGQGGQWQYELAEATDWSADFPLGANEADAACYPLYGERRRVDVIRFAAPQSGRYQVHLTTDGNGLGLSVERRFWARNRCAFADVSYDLSCQQGLLESREPYEMQLDLMQDQPVFLFVGHWGSQDRDPYVLTLSRLD